MSANQTQDLAEAVAPAVGFLNRYLERHPSDETALQVNENLMKAVAHSGKRYRICPGWDCLEPVFDDPDGNGLCKKCREKQNRQTIFYPEEVSGLMGRLGAGG